MIKYLLVLALVSRVVVGQKCLTCNPGACRPHPSCPAVDVFLIFISHPNCAMFYQCNRGFACEMHCPAGLHWSVQHARCEWPNIACCDRNIPCIPAPPSVPTPAPIITTTPEPITTTAAPITTTAAPTTTPAPVTTTPAPITTTPAPITTTPAPITTTPAPITTTPAPITTTPAPITTTPAPITTTPAPITTTVAPTPPPTNCINDVRCPANENPNNPTLLPHENNCNMFYKCANTQRCPMTCPPGQHFGAQLQRCDWPQIACCDPSVPCQAPTPPPVTTLPPPVTPVPPPVSCVADARCPVNENPNNPTVIPHERDCTYFYKCSLGQRCPVQCPPGQHYGAALGRCDWPNIACCDPNVPCQAPPVTTIAPPVTTVQPAAPVTCVTDARCPINENPNNPTHLRHETDCAQFYKCAHGQRCSMQCKNGEHFSMRTLRCEWPNIACCDPRVPCQAGLTKAAPLPTVATSCEPDIGCPLTGNLDKPLLLPNPASCSSFYKCQSGEACLIPCPAGQHWSRQHNRCELPNVACCDADVCKP